MQILNEIPVHEPNWLIIASGIVGIVSAIIGLCWVIASVTDKSYKGIIGAGIVLIVGVIFAYAAIHVDTTRAPDYFKYQVIIDESIAVNDFYDQYEILDRDGLIYTVREIKADK